MGYTMANSRREAAECSPFAKHVACRYPIRNWAYEHELWLGNQTGRAGCTEGGWPPQYCFLCEFANHGVVLCRRSSAESKAEGPGLLLPLQPHSKKDRLRMS